MFQNTDDPVPRISCPGDWLSVLPQLLQIFFQYTMMGRDACRWEGADASPSSVKMLRYCTDGSAGLESGREKLRIIF
jgi:hypothetical protein